MSDWVESTKRRVVLTVKSFFSTQHLMKMNNSTKCHGSRTTYFFILFASLQNFWGTLLQRHPYVRVANFNLKCRLKGVNIYTLSVVHYTGSKKHFCHFFLQILIESAIFEHYLSFCLMLHMCSINKQFKVEKYQKNWSEKWDWNFVYSCGCILCCSHAFVWPLVTGSLTKKEISSSRRLPLFALFTHDFSRLPAMYLLACTLLCVFISRRSSTVSHRRTARAQARSTYTGASLWTKKSVDALSNNNKLCV
jgi:hypothetical protein